MTWTPAFHSMGQTDEPLVFHDNTPCFEGQRIGVEQRRKGVGSRTRPVSGLRETEAQWRVAPLVKASRLRLPRRSPWVPLFLAEKTALSAGSRGSHPGV
jgi:hypothetical protein